MSLKSFFAEDDRGKEYIRAIIFSAIGAPIVTYISCNSCAHDFGRFMSTTLVSGFMWTIMWVGNSELTHQISKKISWVQFPVKRLIVGVISTIIFTVLVSVGLLKLWEYSRGISFNTYRDFIIISLIITFFISLFLHGREFLLRWKKAAVEVEQYQKESISAQYEVFKSQVNPHFLFNSLNVLTNLVYQDQEKAVQFIKKMSDVYRYLLDTRNQELVDLQEELHFTESYIYLQKIRFGDNLQINYQLTNATGKVLPLAIQMLVENAIKHNQISSEHPLQINIKKEENYILVENSVSARLSPLEKSSGVGLENIKKRYGFLTNAEVIITQTPEKFVVKLPLMRAE